MKSRATFTYLDGAVLPLANLKVALETCSEEVFWTPAHAEGILCVPLTDEGMAGGVEVPGYKQRHKFQGLVVAVNKTEHVKVGDLINFDMGRGEEITTYLGESFFHITEKNVSAVDEEFSPEPAPVEPKEKQMPSGLWIATE